MVVKASIRYLFFYGGVAHAIVQAIHMECCISATVHRADLLAH